MCYMTHDFTVSELYLILYITCLTDYCSLAVSISLTVLTLSHYVVSSTFSKALFQTFEKRCDENMNVNVWNATF